MSRPPLQLYNHAASRKVKRYFAEKLFYTRKERVMANEGYHEPYELLSDDTRDMHRAIISLMEELEAVDWYNQRIDVCKDEELRRF